MFTGLFLLINLTGQAQTSNLQTSNLFFKAYEAADFDLMATYWSDSVMQQDLIVGELYGIEGVWHGKETVLSMWKRAFSRKPHYIKIDIREQFTSGNYVVTDLSYESGNNFGGKAGITRGEMFTIFKFDEGKIIEHYDFGDYFAWERQIQSITEGKHNLPREQASNLKVAEEYIAAYSQKDVDKMFSLYAENVDFKDLTAKDIFGGDNFEKHGRNEVKAFWKQVLVDSKPDHVDVKINGMFYSGSYVMLNTTFSMVLPSAWTNGVKNVMVSFPIKTILQIKEGKILQHLDFADYDTYNQQIKLQTRKEQ